MNPLPPPKFGHHLWMVPNGFIRANLHDADEAAAEVLEAAGIGFSFNFCNALVAAECLAA